MKSTLKKVCVMAALLTFGAAGAASAGSQAITGGTTTFATELFGTGSAATDLTVGTSVYTMAATPGGGSAFNITYTLDKGATWGTALTSTSLSFADTDASTPASAVSILLVSGGGADDSTAVFRVDVNASISAGDQFTLAYDVDDANALATEGTELKIAIALTDNLGIVDTADSDVYADSAVEYEPTFTAAAAVTIDVATASKKFFGNGTDIPLGTINSALNLAGVDAAGAAFAIAAGDTGLISLTGDFSAALATDADSDETTFDGVYIDVDGNNAWSVGDIPADTLDGTTATFDLTNAELAGGVSDINGFIIRMSVDGETAIEEMTPVGTFSVDYATTTYRDYTDSAKLATLAKNGDTADSDLALTPNGFYGNYLRLTNKSSLSGNVFITVWNDAGDSVTIELGDIAGQTTQLDAQSSTSLFNINDVYAAAQAADSTFDVDGGKLRLRAEGEFSDIEIQSITISQDGNSFSTF